jgi:hypothetical protein
MKFVVFSFFKSCDMSCDSYWLGCRIYILLDLNCIASVGVFLCIVGSVYIKLSFPSSHILYLKRFFQHLFNSDWQPKQVENFGVIFRSTGHCHVLR